VFPSNCQVTTSSSPKDCLRKPTLIPGLAMPLRTKPPRYSCTQTFNLVKPGWVGYGANSVMHHCLVKMGNLIASELG